MGLATTLWPVVDLPHEPSRAAIERRVALARERLGEDVWRDAWAAGASMAADLAVTAPPADALDEA